MYFIDYGNIRIMLNNGVLTYIFMYTTTINLRVFVNKNNNRKIKKYIFVLHTYIHV